MVRSSAFNLSTLGLSSALCLLFVTSSSHAAKPEHLRAMGTHVDCRGVHTCASWLTTNFAGKRPLAIIAKRGSIASIASLGRRSDPPQGPDIEEGSGGSVTDPGTGADTPADGGNIVADNNNGHGNDPGHVDDSNPESSSDNQTGAVTDTGNDPGNADGANPGQGGTDQQSNGSGNDGANQGNDSTSGVTHDDNGHGNDPGGTDSSNPGQGAGQSNNSSGNAGSAGGADNNGADNGNAGHAASNGNQGQHDDNGHGNDPGHSDSSNPGKAK